MPCHASPCRAHTRAGRVQAACTDSLFPLSTVCVCVRVSAEQSRGCVAHACDARTQRKMTRPESSMQVAGRSKLHPNPLSFYLSFFGKQKKEKIWRKKLGKQIAGSALRHGLPRGERGWLRLVEPTEEAHVSWPHPLRVARHPYLARCAHRVAPRRSRT